MHLRKLFCYTSPRNYKRFFWKCSIASQPKLRGTLILVGHLDDFTKLKCLKTITIHNRNLVLFRNNSQIYALDRYCFHEGSDLDQGKVIEIGNGDRLAVTCPWHNHTIALDSGQTVVQGEPQGSSKQRIHKTKITSNGDIYIELFSNHIKQQVTEEDNQEEEQPWNLHHHLKYYPSDDFAFTTDIIPDILLGTLSPGQMRSLYPGIWQTKPQKNQTSVNTCAYILQTLSEKIVLYNSSQLSQTSAFHQYLSDRTDLTFNNTSHSKATIHCHEKESTAVASSLSINLDKLISFNTQFKGSKDFEIIPTPGYQPGSSCFLWKNVQGKRFLFTGNTIFLIRGIWHSTFDPCSSAVAKKQLLQSLDLIRSLSFDVLVPGKWQGNIPFYDNVTNEIKNSMINRIIRSLNLY